MHTQNNNNNNNNNNNKEKNKKVQKVQKPHRYTQTFTKRKTKNKNKSKSKARPNKSNLCFCDSINQQQCTGFTWLKFCVLIILPVEIGAILGQNILFMHIHILLCCLRSYCKRKRMCAAIYHRQHERNQRPSPSVHCFCFFYPGGESFKNKSF